MQLRPLCVLDDIPNAGGLGLTLEESGGSRHLALFRSNQEVVAYLNVCPHMGRSLDWAPGEFLFAPNGQLICPHHGATFELTDGLCVEGPCRGESLRPVAVEVRDGAVYLCEPGLAGETLEVIR
jgi:nitrite reductase/ring-hydroxylating ferredoxin subunit